MNVLAALAELEESDTRLDTPEMNDAVRRMHGLGGVR